MVTLPVVEGAVNSPVEVIVPALADHANVVPEPLAPMVLHCDVVLGAMIAGVHETETLPLVIGPAFFADPQPQRKTAHAEAANVRKRRLGLIRKTAMHAAVHRALRIV